MARTQRTTKIAARAYKLKQQGIKMAQIAELLDVSERMVFRYIEQHELDLLRSKMKTIRVALASLDKETKQKVLDAIEQAKTND